jgi:mRNA-degrading endonuclease toxin of MazEF toxin-antitoxin module
VGGRPALVMTREAVIDSLSEVFVVLVTTRIRGIPTQVELGSEDGMPASVS